MQVELYENRLDQIRSIHYECDDPVDWIKVYNRQAPFQKEQEGPNERETKQRLNAYQPGLFDRLFKRSEAKVHKLEEEIGAAALKDKQLCEEWNHAHLTAKRVHDREIDAYFEVIDEFGPLDDLVEFGNGFEFGTDQSDVIHVSFDVNSENVVPQKALSLTNTGKLSEKNLTKTAYFDIYQDYVCSCALRNARDIFATFFEPLKFSLFHKLWSVKFVQW